MHSLFAGRALNFWITQEMTFGVILEVVPENERFLNLQVQVEYCKSGTELCFA